MVSISALFSGMSYEAVAVGVQTAEIVLDHEGNATLTLYNDRGDTIAENLPIEIRTTASSMLTDPESISLTLLIKPSSLILSIPGDRVL
jgi:hypothetical protein